MNFEKFEAELKSIDDWAGGWEGLEAGLCRLRRYSQGMSFMGIELAEKHFESGELDKAWKVLREMASIL